MFVCQSFLHTVLPFFTDVEVQLERLSFTVEEEVGSIAICVNVSGENNSCPIGYDVRVILSTRKDTAGIYSYDIDAQDV